MVEEMQVTVFMPIVPMRVVAGLRSRLRIDEIVGGMMIQGNDVLAANPTLQQRARRGSRRRECLDAAPGGLGEAPDVRIRRAPPIPYESRRRIHRERMRSAAGMRATARNDSCS